MRTELHKPFDLVSELRAGADRTSRLLHSEVVSGDLTELIEETFVAGVLANQLPEGIDRLRIDIHATFRVEPVLERVGIRVSAEQAGKTWTYDRSFATGRWTRSNQAILAQLREEGTLPPDLNVYHALVAIPPRPGSDVAVPVLQSPPIVPETLEDFGIRSLGAGQLSPERPVLVNERFVTDGIRRCVEAGTTETGGAALGKIVRLPEPLPGTQTPMVTILSALIEDPRHRGAPLSFSFSPAGLVEAARIGRLRGSGESVLTVFHTHGWKESCGNCNQNANCPLAECTPSLQDYVLLESLFASKATLLPIAGRKLGESGRHPVLRIYAWQGGEMRPIRFQQYSD